MKNAAQVIRDNGSRILEAWSEKVKAEVPASKVTNSIALYDHLPNLLIDISDIIFNYDSIEDISKNSKYQGIIKNSVEHGRHRATSLYYTVDQIVHEYIIFHRELTEVLTENDVFSIEVSNLLKYLIETSILESVGSFSRSINEMQEKLIGTLAHDIRNPLSATELALGLMDYKEGEEPFIQLRDAARRSVARSLSLVEGLMDSISVKAGEGMMFNFSDIDLLNEILWVYKEAKEIYTKDIKIIITEEKIYGVFDGTAIRRLLENLLSNAVKYGAARTPITLTVENHKDSVKICVHNFGNPIEKEKLNHIFTFLGRDNPDTPINLKSWGIGLTLVKLVSDAHGGSIEVKSDESNGTKFIVELKKHYNLAGKKRVKLIREIDGM